MGLQNISCRYTYDPAAQTVTIEWQQNVVDDATSLLAARATGSAVLLDDATLAGAAKFAAACDGAAAAVAGLPLVQAIPDREAMAAVPARIAALAQDAANQAAVQSVNAQPLSSIPTLTGLVGQPS